jgi:hypothetical protein
MQIEKIISILTNRLATLAAAKTHAEVVGDLDRVVAIDAEIEETQATLAKLQNIE